MVLVVSSLKKSFGPRVLWENIDLRAERGTLTGLIGASGSGKSTLLNCIGLLTAPDGGRISFDGVELLEMGSTRRRIFRRDTLGYLFQNYALMEDATVKENLVAWRLNSFTVWWDNEAWRTNQPRPCRFVMVTKRYLRRWCVQAPQPQGQRSGRGSCCWPPRESRMR